MKVPILIAGFSEDIAEIIFCMKDYFASTTTYQPYTALSGKEAFDCLERDQPYLIVIYFGASAKAASLKWLEEVRKKYGSYFKVLMMTTYPATSLRAECQRLKINDCLEVPMKLELIKKSVDMVLN